MASSRTLQKLMSRRWNQFSLRTILILVAACAVLAGIWVAYFEPYRPEQQILAKMQGKQITVSTEVVGPGWLKWLTQGRYAKRVVRVDLGQDVTDSDLARLTRFRHLRTVMIANGPQITDKGLSHFAKMPCLEVLMLAGTHVTNAGVIQLQGVQSLRKLWIGSDNVTDDGLIPIGRLAELRELAVQADVTDKGMEHLTSLTKLETLRCLSLDEDEERLRSALSKPAEFDFKETPLLDACGFLANQYDAQIRLDHESFEAVDTNPRDLTVTGAGRGEPFGECFQSLLRPNGLCFRVESSGLVVTTLEAARRAQQGISALQRALPTLKHVEVSW